MMETSGGGVLQETQYSRTFRKNNVIGVTPMPHFRKATAAFACVTALVTFGCVSVGPRDSWNRIPTAPSAYYRPIADAEARSDQRPEREQTRAPTPEKNAPWTLAECLRTALERNPRTRASWEAARAAAARVRENRAAYLPSVDLRSETARGRTVALDSEKEGNTRNTYAAGIDVSYLLFDGGARRARVEGAEAALLEADFRHNTTLQEIALEVEESYYERLGAQWLLKVAQATVKRTQYQLDLAQARREEGLVTRADVLRAETQRAEAELLLVQARNGTQISHGRLARAMGLAVHTPFEIAELPSEIGKEELPRIEQLLDEAAQQRPELRAALARIETVRTEVAGARAAWWPALRAGLSAGRRDTTFVPERDEWSAGLSVTYPLFAGFERTARSQRARADLARAMAEHAYLLQGIEFEVWTAYWRLIESTEAVEAAAKLTASANESARLAEGEYRNGVISIIGLIDAQTAQTEAERRLVQSRLDRYTAKAQFERAVGRALADQAAPAAYGKAER